MTDIAAGKVRARHGLRGHARPRALRAGENPVTGVRLRAVRADRAGGADRALGRPLRPARQQHRAGPAGRRRRAHWFGTDQLGRDIFSRVVVATRLDFVIAVASVALVFLMGGLAGVAAGFFGGWTDRIVIAHRRHHHGLSAVRAGHGHRRRARQHGAEHHPRHRHRQLPALRPRRARRGQRAARGRLRARRRGSPATASCASCWCTSCPTSCRS